MPGASGAIWTLLTLAWLTVTFSDGEPAGLTPRGLAGVFLGLAAAILVLAWIFDRSRAGPGAAARALSLCLLVAAGGWTGFVHRDALLQGIRELTEDTGLAPPDAVVGTGGEVVVTRRLDGSFAVPVRVNDRPVRFLFDTGATSVVLGEETARGLGLLRPDARFDVGVMTANGRGLAAAIMIERIAVGPIEVRRVPGLVVRAGLLDGNLLGQSFLERLTSYEVRGNKLVLRADPPATKRNVRGTP